MVRDAAVSGSLGLQEGGYSYFYWYSTSDWPLSTATMDAGLLCNRRPTMRLKSWDSLLARLEETSQLSSTNKAGKDKKGDALPLHAHHNTMAITGLIGHFTENPAHPVLTLPLFPRNTG